MTQPRGMIADTWHLDRAGFTAGPPENADEAKALDEIQAVTMQNQAPKITSGPVRETRSTAEAIGAAVAQRWRDFRDTPLQPASRLELHERDARLVALDLAIRTLETGAAKTEITARAEAFLAFLAGGGSGN